MAGKLTDFGIKNLKAGTSRREIPAGARGLYLVMQPSGVKSFAVRYRFKGKPQKLTLGRWQSPADLGATDRSPEPKIGDAVSLASARKLAGDILLQVAHGVDPRAALTVAATHEGLKVGGAYDWDAADEDREQKDPGLLDLFIDRYCRKEKRLRSTDQIASTFARLVAPEIGDLPVFGEGRLRRSHIVSMLDEIEDENGPVMADRTLAYVRKAFNWFAARNEEFTNPIVKGLRAVGTNSRNRILSDEEIRDLWAALDIVENVPECYPRFVKSLLLTMTRRNETALMHSSELDGADWTIPADRYKTKLDHLVPLSAMARALIGDKPAGAEGNSWFVFSTTSGAKGFSGFSKAKRELDKAIAQIRARDGRPPMPQWVLHDLRRSGRSLMSRAGVSSDHAERCLGHVIGGVRGVYDRYDFLEEKRAAFAALAELVEHIIRPVGDGPRPSGTG